MVTDGGLSRNGAAPNPCAEAELFGATFR